MKVVAEASDGATAVQRALDAEARRRRHGHLDARDERARRDAHAEAGAAAHAAIVTLTRHGDDAYLQELLRAGVSGYVLKQSAPTELLQAIRAAAAGGQYLDSDADRAGDGRVPRHERASGSSKSAAHAQRARGGGAAADRVRLQQQGDRRAGSSLSVKTVEAHKANAMRKLGLTGRIDIVKYAVLQGWLDNA